MKQESKKDFRSDLLIARVRALLHLLRFAKIETPSAGDSLLAIQAMNDIGVMLDAKESAPVAQEPMPRASLIDLMRDAENIVRQKHVWKKFINGTPLNNDIPVWMAEFALQLLDSAPPAAEQLDTARVPKPFMDCFYRNLSSGRIDYLLEKELRALLRGGEA